MAATLPVDDDRTASPPDPGSLERSVFAVGVAAVALVLVLIIALPLGTLLAKSFTDTDGAFVGLTRVGNGLLAAAPAQAE